MPKDCWVLGTVTWSFASLPSRLSSCNRLDLLDNKTEVQRGQRSSCPEPQRQGARSVLIEFSVGYQLVRLADSLPPSSLREMQRTSAGFILGVLG